MKLILGKQGFWNAQTGENGDVKISREDGKFFEIAMITKGYDRPIVLNYGIGKIAAILMDGKVATEPETIVTSLDGEQTIQQDRILRASSDNPNYSGLPQNDVKTGANFLDSQRIIYRDGATESHVSAATELPKRKIKINGEESFVDCKLISFKELGQTADGPGKVALFDAIAKYLTNEELAEMVNKISERIAK